MSADEIKKALERYIALYGRDICIADNIKVADVLEVINRLEEENESLNNTLQREYQAHNEYIFNTMVENKRLKNNLKTAKAEAYKEFAERLKNKLTSCSKTIDGESEYLISDFDIDNLLKEMGVE